MSISKMNFSAMVFAKAKGGRMLPHDKVAI